VILLLGIFLAIGAFMLILFLGGGGRPAATPTPAIARIVVAVVDIPQGTTITESMLRVQDIALVDTPGDAFSLPETVIGKVARQTVASGAYVPQAAITGVAGVVDVAGELKPGERAFALQLDDPNDSLGFLIQPGDRVDVIVTLHHIPIGFLFNLDPNQKIITDTPIGPGPVVGPAGGTGFQLVRGNDDSSAKLLIQNVRVVYAKVEPQAQSQSGQGTPPPGSGGLLAGPQLIILAVNAQQVEVLGFVKEHLQGQDPDYPAGMVSNITLALRSPEDAEATPDITTGIVLRSLLDDYGVLPPRLVIVGDQGR
jgi:Flp pilus assembly protein CpaB